MLLIIHFIPNHRSFLRELLYDPRIKLYWIDFMNQKCDEFKKNAKITKFLYLHLRKEKEAFDRTNGKKYTF